MLVSSSLCVANVRTPASTRETGRSSRFRRRGRPLRMAKPGPWITSRRKLHEGQLFAPAARNPTVSFRPAPAINSNPKVVRSGSVSDIRSPRSWYRALTGLPAPASHQSLRWAGQRPIPHDGAPPPPPPPHLSAAVQASQIAIAITLGRILGRATCTAAYHPASPPLRLCSGSLAALSGTIGGPRIPAIPTTQDTSPAAPPTGPSPCAAR